MTALRVRIVGVTDAHSELNRDAEQIRNEAISIASECGDGLFWVERVQVATQPRWDREELLKRDDPIGEVARILCRSPSGRRNLSNLGFNHGATKQVASRTRRGSGANQAGHGYLKYGH